MKKSALVFIMILTSFLSLPVYSQSEGEDDLLGLPGDNLDLFAVLNLFQSSKTVEDFEKSLNEEETGINNLDLNLDEKVDFIKVKTEEKGDDFTFILQVDVTEEETQDVAVILLSKDDNGDVTMQIVGDEELYGDDYVVEPKPATKAVTPNPGYVGDDPVTDTVVVTNTVVVESAPIVQYVYSPVYVPYYPPYHYGYYPPYFAAFTVMAVGIYRHNNYYHHNYYHGGYGNTVVIHNTNNYNNYNRTRNTSNTVNHNKSNGNYNRGNNASTRPSTKPSNRPTTQPSRPSTQPSKPASRPSTQPSKPTNKASTRPSNSSQRQSPSTRPANTGGRAGAGASRSGGGGRAGAASRRR